MICPMYEDADLKKPCQCIPALKVTDSSKQKAKDAIARKIIIGTERCEQVVCFKYKCTAKEPRYSKAEKSKAMKNHTFSAMSDEALECSRNIVKAKLAEEIGLISQTYCYSTGFMGAIREPFESRQSVRDFRKKLVARRVAAYHRLVSSYMAYSKHAKEIYKDEPDKLKHLKKLTKLPRLRDFLENHPVVTPQQIQKLWKKQNVLELAIARHYQLSLRVALVLILDGNFKFLNALKDLDDGLRKDLDQKCVIFAMNEKGEIVEQEFALQETHKAIGRLIQRMCDQNQFEDIEQVCVVVDDPKRYEGALKKFGINYVVIDPKHFLERMYEEFTKPAGAEKKEVEIKQQKFRKALSDAIYETEMDGHRIIRTDKVEMAKLFENAVKNADGIIFKDKVSVEKKLKSCLGLIHDGYLSLPEHIPPYIKRVDGKKRNLQTSSPLEGHFGSSFQFMTDVVTGVERGVIELTLFNFRTNLHQAHHFDNMPEILTSDVTLLLQTASSVRDGDMETEYLTKWYDRLMPDFRDYQHFDTVVKEIVRASRTNKQSKVMPTTSSEAEFSRLLYLRGFGTYRQPTNSDTVMNLLWTEREKEARKKLENILKKGEYSSNVSVDYYRSEIGLHSSELTVTHALSTDENYLLLQCYDVLRDKNDKWKDNFLCIAILFIVCVYALTQITTRKGLELGSRWMRYIDHRIVRRHVEDLLRIRRERETYKVKDHFTAKIVSQVLPPARSCSEKRDSTQLSPKDARFQIESNLALLVKSVKNARQAVSPNYGPKPQKGNIFQDCMDLGCILMDMPLVKSQYGSCVRRVETKTKQTGNISKATSRSASHSASEVESEAEADHVSHEENSDGSESDLDDNEIVTQYVEEYCDKLLKNPRKKANWTRLEARLGKEREIKVSKEALRKRASRYMSNKRKVEADKENGPKRTKLNPSNCNETVNRVEQQASPLTVAQASDDTFRVQPSTSKSTRAQNIDTAAQVQPTQPTGTSQGIVERFLNNGVSKKGVEFLYEKIASYKKKEDLLQKYLNGHQKLNKPALCLHCHVRMKIQGNSRRETCYANSEHCLKQKQSGTQMKLSFAVPSAGKGKEPQT
eukprot:Nk52_evm22s263 gene=Nk52_evmTU22s263